MQSPVEKTCFTALLVASLLTGIGIGSATGEVNYLSLVVFGYSAPVTVFVLLRSDMFRFSGVALKLLIHVSAVVVVLGNLFNAYRISIHISGGITPLLITLALLMVTAIVFQVVFHRNDAQHEA